MHNPADNLEVYLVGGAVRDQMLGLPVQDRDWLVVGSSVSQMLELGFKPVGEHFPVFLHPHSSEQYALARRERKTAKGYRGFAISSVPSVSVEQDLKRRDLTINAMAVDRDGKLIDPFGGAADLHARQLRHVSSAFSEDPVRVLRVARFMARFATLGFCVHMETRTLMTDMVNSGEVDALQPQRVWQELEGALCEAAPECFISELRECGALAKILPEVEALFGVPQDPVHHPEIDTGKHILMALTAAAQLSDSPRMRFAVLTHDLGKALTPKHLLPKHPNHEQAGLEPLEALCKRLPVPRKYQQLARKVCQYHLLHHRLAELEPAAVLDLLQAIEAFRQPHEMQLFSQCCTADLRGRPAMQDLAYPQAELLADYQRVAQAVNGAEVAAQCTTDEQIQHAIRQQRIAAIAQLKQQINPP